MQPALRTTRQQSQGKARVSSRACHLLLATIEIQVTPAAQEFFQQTVDIFDLTFGGCL
jgi:hypothetical protein